ncbi:bifunctional DNA primase/polymerase [Mycobacterium neumannii]|uniref:bifunctional DNA primase/polymerase n=1 Tax=Mycobacterium neumannii TaxID=2048551 RepID=UPI003AB132C4
MSLPDTDRHRQLPEFHCGNGAEAYGAHVDYLADGWCEVEYDGLDADVFTAIALRNLETGWGAVACGRIDWTKPHVTPHKTPWHAGVTGYDGIDATPAQIAEWPENVVRRIAFGHERGLLNIGARLPVGVIGIDVDDYDSKHGGTTLAEHEARLGPLPPTYLVTSRGYGVSGVRLYRVPPQWCGVGVLDGGDVELLQRHHRFVVAPGGLHRSGAHYRLYGPQGDVIASGVLPSPNALPVLSDAWLTDLHRQPRKRGTPATTGDLRQAAEEWCFDEYPQALRKTVRDVLKATGEGQTRNAYHRALWIAARKARAGCYPWTTARDAIEAAAIAAYAERGRGLDVEDFNRSTEHAVSVALDMTAAEIAKWGGERVPIRTCKPRRPHAPRRARRIA